VSLGIGDDAALLEPTPGHQLVVASDTLVEGVHFPSSASPQQVASRALCVNLSDMAAMGAVPRWFTLALTLPSEKANADWLSGFSAGLAKVASQYSVALVGGDTTSGPLTITLTLLGEVPQGEGLTRAGAAPGDAVFVTGTLGDCAAALNLILRKNSILEMSDRLLQRFYCPQPQIQAGLTLRPVASACIDISDGLVADLGHLCKASGVTAAIQAQLLPIAEDVRNFANFSDNFSALDWALTGGDDYQLCFTVAPESLSIVDDWIEQGQLQATRIGVLSADDKSIDPVTVVDKNNKILIIEKAGYNHFGH